MPERLRLLPIIATFVLMLAPLAHSVYVPKLPGDDVADFSLTAHNGEMYTLSQFRDSTVVVVMFISTRCPVSKDYDQRMSMLAKDFAGKGVQFLGINSNRQEALEEIATHAGKSEFIFPVLKDSGNVIADRFGATRTPEVFVLNKARVVLYHGRIDDNRKAARVESSDLRKALDAILSGNPAPKANTSAFGCSIKRIKR
jgi:peroxiredoxin